MVSLLLLLMELNTKNVVQMFSNCTVVRIERLVLLELATGEIFSLP